MRILTVAILLLLIATFSNLTNATQKSPSNVALLLELQGAIGPASNDFIVHGLEKARTRNATIIILKIDTPGGLDSSMRDIIQAILASPIPVIGYVAPEGARAASAGTYILYACHIAAMAPATNLGAATPVQIGGLPVVPNQPENKPPTKSNESKLSKSADSNDANPAEIKQEKSVPPKAHSKMERKMINDARAYIRALAQMRGRNVEWAEQAVTDAVSLSAEDALKAGVIDLIAVNASDLLQKINGRFIEISGQQYRLITQNLVIEALTPDWRNQLLAIIAHPMIAYVLLLLGFYGLFFELVNPGTAVPGVLGGICLLLALFAFQIMPINYAGLALLLLGLIFMGAEAFIPSFGILGIGGLIAFIAGSLLLWDESNTNYGVPVGLIIGLAFTSATLLVGILTMTLHHHRKPVLTGAEQMLGLTGEIMADGQRVWVHGESWHIHADQTLYAGQAVQVTARDGLTLFVTPLNSDKEDA